MLRMGLGLRIGNKKQDKTSPTLSSVSLSSITTTAATLNFTSDEVGTYYYLVYAAADAAPTAATIKAQGTAVAKGTNPALKAANTASITGLTAGTSYKTYLIVEDAAGNASSVSTSNLATVEAIAMAMPSYSVNDGSGAVAVAATGGLYKPKVAMSIIAETPVTSTNTETVPTMPTISVATAVE